MIDNIVIERLRGIKRCVIGDFGRFNLFLGYNNCGKSTLLDGLCLFLSMDNPTANIGINRFRQLYSVGRRDLKLIFYNLKVDKPISLTGKVSGVEKAVEISYWEKAADSFKIDEVTTQQNQPKMEYGLSMKSYETDLPEKSVEASIYFYSDKDNKGNQKVSLEVGTEHIPYNYLSSIIGHDVSYESFLHVVKAKQEREVLEVLQKIEPSIKDIVLADNKVLVDIGLAERVPIQVMGDGVRKIFSVVVAIYDCRGGVLMVDELENGLHFKSIPILWQAIIIAATKFDVQVFATTHNIDSLHAVNDILQGNEHSKVQKEWRAYTLKKNSQNELKAYAHNYTQFNYLLNQNLEIR